MKTNTSQDFDAVFARIKTRFIAGDTGGLICKQGFYKNCFVLKLQKTCWTNDSMDRLQNESGVFFSIWVEEKAASRNRANYNIHALKLRDLRGYSIASRDFADAFRNSFASVQLTWPNICTDYGPQTLMQGWIQFSPNSCEEKVFALMQRFVRLSPTIDRLLESRRKLPPNLHQSDD